VLRPRRRGMAAEQHEGRSSAAPTQCGDLAVDGRRSTCSLAALPRNLAQAGARRRQSRERARQRGASALSARSLRLAAATRARTGHAENDRPMLLLARPKLALEAPCKSGTPRCEQDVVHDALRTCQLRSARARASRVHREGCAKLSSCTGSCAALTRGSSPCPTRPYSPLVVPCRPHLDLRRLCCCALSQRFDVTRSYPPPRRSEACRPSSSTALRAAVRSHSGGFGEHRHFALMLPRTDNRLAAAASSRCA
jgi:hypothetical protein